LPHEQFSGIFTNPQEKVQPPISIFWKKYIFDRNSEEKGCIAKRQASVLLSQGSGGVLQLLSAATLFASAIF
jgi:hypothetical protein